MQTSSERAQKRRRIAFVLLDGIGDVDIPDLGYLTPLKAAATPTLDAIAGAGLNGLMDPVEPGLACGSDTAHLSIFGYDPRLFYRGRGAFESLGAGLRMDPGDIAFKSNFATLDSKGIVLKRRADRRFEEEGPILCKALDGLKLPSFPQHSIRVKYATEHRCGVVVAGPGLCDSISGTDPLRDNLSLQEAKALDESPEAAHTAAVVAEVSEVLQKALQGHEVNMLREKQGKSPANLVLLRGCGSRLAVEPFEARHGMRACMVAPTKIIAGLGMTLGIEVLDVPKATGDYKTSFSAKAEAIAKALTGGAHDFGFLHVKAIDDTGHDKATALKVRYFEVVDVMIRQLILRLAESEEDGAGEFSVVVTGDHSTPVVFGDHSHEPIPFAIAHIKDIIEALGGLDLLRKEPLREIPHPLPEKEQPPLHQLGLQAKQRLRESAQFQFAIAGDTVCAFDEITAAEGCLGRFPGSEVLSIIKQVART